MLHKSETNSDVSSLVNFLWYMFISSTCSSPIQLKFTAFLYRQCLIKLCISFSLSSVLFENRHCKVPFSICLGEVLIPCNLLRLIHVIERACFIYLFLICSRPDFFDFHSWLGFSLFQLPVSF